MESGGVLRAGRRLNPGLELATLTPIFCHVDRGGYVAGFSHCMWQNPLPPCSSLFRSYPRIPRPDRHEAQESGRTGATPACRGLLVTGVGPGGAPAHPRLGVAPVRFIPAGRLGCGPQLEPGSTGTGAKAGPQNGTFVPGKAVGG